MWVAAKRELAVGAGAGRARWLGSLEGGGRKEKDDGAFSTGPVFLIFLGVSLGFSACLSLDVSGCFALSFSGCLALGFSGCLALGFSGCLALGFSVGFPWGVPGCVG